MNRLEQLTLKLIDEGLTDDETRELRLLISRRPEAARNHVALLGLEAALRGQRLEFDLVEPTLARLRTELGASCESAVMARIKAGPIPLWRGQQSRLTRTITAWRASVSAVGSRGVRFLTPRVAVALAAVVVLLAIAGFLLFGTGEQVQVIATVSGGDFRVQRGNETLAPQTGLRLQAGDMVFASAADTTVLNFAPEKMWLELRQNAALKILEIGPAKRFDLRQGAVEADVAPQPWARLMIVHTPNAEATVLGTVFSLALTTNETRLEVLEGAVRFKRLSDGRTVKVRSGERVAAMSDAGFTTQPIRGRLVREIWTGIPGGSVNDLIFHSAFPGQPSRCGFLSSFEVPPTKARNYGVRVRGFVHPPASGNYKFFIAGADDGLLWLSPDDDPASKVRVAYSRQAGPHEWKSLRPVFGTRQQSGPVALVAGRKYYIEAVLKVDDGDGHLSVAWEHPDGQIEVIAGDCLSPVKPERRKGTL